MVLGQPAKLVEDKSTLGSIDPAACYPSLHFATGELIGSTLLYVCWCPDSDQVLRSTEMLRWAISELMRCSK